MEIENVSIHDAAFKANIVALRSRATREPASLQSLDSNGYFPLQWAVLSGSNQSLQVLIELGGPQLLSLIDGSERKQSAMHWASVKGSINACDVLLSHGGLELLEQRDATDSTPIHLAATSGNISFLYHLAVKHKVEISTLVDGQSRTTLHLAAMGGHLDLVRLLLVLDSDVTAIDVEGKTPLHLAALNGHTDVCRTLLLGGSVSLLNAQDNTGNTPAQLAEMNGHSSAATMIVGFKLSERMKREGCYVNGRLIGLPSWLFLNGSHLGLLPWLYSGAMTYLYCTFLWPDPYSYPDLDQYSWVGVVGLISALSLLYRAATVDPGVRPTAWDLSKSSGEDLRASTLKILDCPALHNNQWQQICVTCRTVRPLRCVHCSVKDRCVDNFCHWCPWVGNTIGRFNRATLFNFLFVSFATLVLAISIQIERVKRIVSMTDTNGIKAGLFSIPNIFPLSIFLTFGIFISGYAVLLILNHGCAGILWNLTINESSKWQSYKYLTADADVESGSPVIFHNPFDRGPWLNIAEVCFPHQHPPPVAYLKKIFLPGTKIIRGRATKKVVYITE